jgi:hypothetical protein
VGLPNETLEEPYPGQDNTVRNRFACPSPKNIQQPRACLAESGQKMAARTNPGGGAIGSPTSVEENDSGRNEED